jgi:hypothetical protein
VTIDAKPRSLPPSESTMSFTSRSRASWASWSACGASPFWPSPPLDARKMFFVRPPEQLMFSFSSTGTRALLISATSERWQPLSLPPM